MASKRKGTAPVDSGVRSPVSEPVAATVVSSSLDVDALRQIVDMLETSEVTLLSWRRGRERLLIRRGPPPVQAAPSMSAGPAVTAVAPAPAAPAPALVASAPAAAAVEKPGHLVTSPFVGTFYRTPAPDQPPFVEVGSVVKKGQVLCIIEAMKLMNEIESDLAGRVVELLAQNSQPVEFGQALFRIEPI